MADFLTRVAQRALGVAPVVRPVIPSRFAPGFETAAAAAGSEPAAESVAPREKPAPRPAARTIPAEERARTELHADPAPEASKPEVREAAPPQRPPAREGANDIQPKPAGAHPTESQAVPLNVEVAAPAPLAQRAAIAAETRLAARPAAGDEELRPARIAEPRAPGLSAERRARQEQAAEAPPIRITIGRIDVRAILPPAPPAARNGANHGRPALTLEEYTRQRNRKER